MGEQQVLGKFMKKITTKEMEDHFKKIFSNNSSRQFFTELRLGTGYDNEQRVDGFLMHLWPSKGYERIAFEYKISRGDFLKEIKTPQKRQSAKSFSNYFVIVTANDIVKDPREIPQDCGWWVFNGTDIEIKIKPPLLPPCNPDWGFLASMVRNSSNVTEES